VVEVDKFGIKVTVVEPDSSAQACWPPPASVPSKRIDDYAANGERECGRRTPARSRAIGQTRWVLVKLAGMETPRLFVAGADGIAAVAPTVETRLRRYAFEGAFRFDKRQLLIMRP
jgi:hypothetical protein